MFQKARSRNRNQGMVKPGILLPVRILECEEGNTTAKGTSTLKYTFEHLVSKETFTSIVFEGVAPLYISEQILDAVLPKDVFDYNLGDLIGKRLMIEIAFNTKGGTTFINVVQANPLQASFQQASQQDEDHKHEIDEKAIEDIEREMEDDTGQAEDVDYQGDDYDDFDIETEEYDIGLDDSEVDLVDLDEH